MRLLLLLLSALACTPTLAQQNLAIISDKDGFVNVRAEQNVNSVIVGRIIEGELFAVTETKTEWFKVFKPGYRNQLQGFVHKSRIQPLESLNETAKRNLIDGIFSTELEFIKGKTFDEAYNNHHDTRFDFVLNFAADFILETKDEELMRKFIETIKQNTGSADEHPSWILGFLFDKSPDWTILQMKAVGLDKMLIELLEFGFSNITYESKDAARVAELKRKIEGLKK
jgi:hypothetical protein